MPFGRGSTPRNRPNRSRPAPDSRLRRHRRLKRMCADRALDLQPLKAVVRKKWRNPDLSASRSPRVSGPAIGGAGPNVHSRDCPRGRRWPRLEFRTILSSSTVTLRARRRLRFSRTKRSNSLRGIRSAFTTRKCSSAPRRHSSRTASTPTPSASATCRGVSGRSSTSPSVRSVYSKAAARTCFAASGCTGLLPGSAGREPRSGSQALRAPRGPCSLDSGGSCAPPPPAAVRMAEPVSAATAPHAPCTAL